MRGKGDDNQKSRPFSKRTFRKEVNALARKASKKNVLDLVAKTVKREQAKTARRVKPKKGKAKKAESSDSDSDSEESVQMIEDVTQKTKSRKTTVREMEISDDDDVKVASVPNTAKLRIKLHAIQAQLAEAKRMADPTLEEEKSFLAKVAQMEMTEREMEAESSPDDSE